MNRTGITQTEIFPLTLFAIAGMMLFPACNDLLTMFVALEVFSLPLYVMCALARRRRLLSQESALKYFLLGRSPRRSFFSDRRLCTDTRGRSNSTPSRVPSMPMRGTVLSAARCRHVVGGAAVQGGCGAVPFLGPRRVPGAPTPVTAFMAATTKIAAFGALLRVLYVALPGITTDWRPVLWGWPLPPC